MGLLDEAIREHLELKRKHGASDEEIVRAEQEALAPARRDPAAAAAAEAEVPLAEPDLDEAEPPPPPPPPVDEPDEPLEAEPPTAEPSAVDFTPDDATRVREVIAYEEEDDHLAPAPIEAPEPGTPKPHGDPALEEDDGLEPDEVPLEEQLSPGPDVYRARTSILDDPLDEASPPPPSQPPPDAESQDVLEETPEFLQETPEHDKLWFEQKPPRDFDFD
jgi:hypothetical protein